MTVESRVFTNDSIPESPTWQRVTTRLGFVNEGSGSGRPFRSLRNALKALIAAGPDDIVILTDTHNLSASLYGLLLNLSWRRPTVIRTDPLLTLPSSRVARLLKRAYLRAALRLVARVVVWAPAVIDRYVRHFGIPRERMSAQRFHHTISGYSLRPVNQHPYIFAGGDSLRDYETLIESVRELDARVVITTRKSVAAFGVLPDNVEVRAVSPSEFRQLMADARVVVMPLRTDLIRTSGQQSYLNAMALGKPVIVTDTEDAAYYIEHGKTGLLTRSGDRDELRSALLYLLDNPAEAHAIGEAAKAFALPLDQETVWTAILELANQLHEKRHKK